MGKNEKFSTPRLFCLELSSCGWLWYNGAVGTLYLVGVPTGDADDLTYRARRILQAVTVVAADDPGQARQLLDCCEIATPVVPATEDTLARILETEDVAWLSPGLALPGPPLLCAALQAGILVVPIPGPALPITALVLSGLPADSFVYLGELPAVSSVRRALLASVAGQPRTVVCWTPARRLPDVLADWSETVGERPMALMAEQGTIWRGRIGEALQVTESLPAGDRYVLVLGGAQDEAAAWSEERLRAEIRSRLDRGLATREISRQLAAESGWPRRDVYRLAVEVAGFHCTG